jgi:translation initiation factor 1
MRQCCNRARRTGKLRAARLRLAMSSSRLVYSTGAGRVCPECGRGVEACRCKRSRPAVTVPANAAAAPAPRDGIVRVGRETKGRKGKGVTVIHGLPLAGPALEELAARLKKRCGSGGTVDAGIIEIQGDHRDVLVEELGKLGYTVRRAGG